MKKILSVILFFSILMSCIVTYSEGDVQSLSDDMDTRIVKILSGLGFTDAFEEEIFSPYEAVTRSELVSMAMALINAQAAAQSGTVWFSDVSAEHKHYGEISAAAELGIISGYADGAFYPDKEISFDEAVALVMKALGYRVAAEVKGGWSMGYRTVANQIGLTKGINPQNNDALSCIEAAYLIYNAMDCPIFQPIVFGETLSYKADEDCTPLIEYHDIYKADDYVNATSVSALVGYSPTDNEHILIGDKTYRTGKNEYAEYLGWRVEAYYRDNDDIDREIVYLMPSDRLEKLVIKAEDITGFNGFTYLYGDKGRVSVNRNHSLIVNGKRLSEYSESTFVPVNGEVILLSTVGKGYDVVIINTFQNVTLQRASVGGTAVATFTEKYSNRAFEVDMQREDLSFSLYVDGQKFEIEEFEYQTSTDNFFNDENYENTPITTHTTYSFPVIPEGAVASVFADEYEVLNGCTFPSKDAKLIKIYVSTNYIDGKVEKLGNDDSIVIGGTEYKIAHYNSLRKTNEEFKIGVSGRFVLDYDGKIAAWMPDIYADDKYEYGYLIKAVLEGSPLGSTVKAKVLKKDGKIEVFDFSEKARLNSKTVNDAEELLKRLSESAAMLDPTFKISQLIKYKMSGDGKLKDIQTVMQSVGLPDGVDKNQLNRDMERARLSHENNMLHINGGTEKYPNAARLYAPSIYAAHFVVPPSETFNDEDYWVQDTWRVNFSQQSWLYNGWKTVDVFDCDEFKAPGAVVIYEKLADWEFVQSFVMVDKITAEVSMSGSEISVLRGYDGWGPVAYYSDEENMFEGLKQGDFIQIFGGGEKVSRWEMIMPIDEVKNCDLSTIPEDLNNAVYEVYSKNTSKDMVLQRGKPTEDGKREFRRASYFRSGGGPTSGAGSGPLFYADGDNAVFSIFLSGIRDSFTDIKTVLDVGNEDATRVYVRENPGMKTIIVYDFDEEE